MSKPTQPDPPKETNEVKINPVTDGNVRIFRYMYRNREDQKFVEWAIDVYLHNANQQATLWYHTKWERLMLVIEEIEKDEQVANVTVSGKGTVIRFKNGNFPDVFVKVGAEVDKKEACWRTIVNYMHFLEKQKAKEKKKK